MFKRGIALIELSITLSIMICMIFASIPFLNVIKRFKQNLDLNFYCNYTSMFINNCESFCKANKINGKITYISSKNSIVFNTNGTKNKNIKKIKYPQNIKIDEIVCPSKTINIDKNGFNSCGCSIKLKNKYKIRTITIHVGSGYVDLK